jgi:two-component system sensor histidine kinase HydH
MSAPPWLLIGAVVVLLPIVAYMTLINIHREKELTTRLMMEKGAALIRSFEAGTRTGMMGMRGSNFKLQRLLTETAQQPDIVHLLVTDGGGMIVAHNDLKQIGRSYGDNLDLVATVESGKLRWRQLNYPDGTKLFEVYRNFAPTRPPPGMHPRHRMHDRSRIPEFNRKLGLKAPPQIIFVGFDMTAVEKARIADIRRAVIMAVVLLLVGFTGIILLFILQSYRVTRASLARIKAFSSNVVENMPIGLVALDADNRVAAFNQSAEMLLKRNARDLVGRPAARSLPKQLLSALDEARHGAAAIEKQINCPVGSDKTVPLEIGASRLQDEDGNVLGGILLFKDLTEIQALRDEIARNQRLATVGRLAAGVAHEIRNPLSSIKGFATYFKERYREVPEDLQTAGIMVQEVDRLNRVVSQLLEFARPVTLRPREVSLERMLRDSLLLIEKQAARKQITIELVEPFPQEVVKLDPDRISQVLLNLYLNALEAMTNKGVLTVSARLEPDNRQLVVTVSDDGAGIAAEDMAHVFDPYFTTKSSGTGLGLAIAHNIVETAGGQISIESKIHQGTAIAICWPLAS